MLQLLKRIGLCSFANLVALIICYSQEDNYKKITDSIAAKLNRITGHTYYISGTDIDRQIIEDHEIAMVDTFFIEKIKDPYNSLTGCFVFLASDAENQYPELPGFIGIYEIKRDSILWCFMLTNAFSSGALGSVDATDELNQDGKVEIIVSQATGSLAIDHQLWIFNWDGKNGKLITQLDSCGESMIMYWGDKYNIKDIDGDGIYEIQGKWEEGNGSDKKITVTYAWNGALYGKWGKSSKYLLKEKKK